MRRAARDFARAIDQTARTATRRPAPDSPTLAGGRIKGWVGREEIRRINALLAEARAILSAGKPGRGKVLQSLTYVWTPPPAVRRRSSQTGD